MLHRIRAAGLILDARGRLLLVREVDPATNAAFWVPPGGGLEPADTSVIDCVRREVEEETGLTNIEVGRLVYLREFRDTTQDVHHLELFFEIRSYRGMIRTVSASTHVPVAELIRPPQWFDQSELQSLTVYPDELKDQFWTDDRQAIHPTRYLGTKWGDISRID